MRNGGAVVLQIHSRQNSANVLQFLGTLSQTPMKFAIITLATVPIVTLSVFPSFANSRDEFPGRRQGGGTWGTDPAPVEVEKI